MRNLRLTATRNEDRKGTQYVFHKDTEYPDPDKCSSYFIDDSMDAHTVLQLLNNMYVSIVESDLLYNRYSKK